MEFFIENWYLFVSIASLLICIITYFVMFLKLPKEQQIKSLREWLKYAVSMAEKELGGGTGQLKLRRVYEMAIEKFPWITSFYSFEEFSNDVDEALKWMNKQLDENSSVKKLVKGE